MITVRRANTFMGHSSSEQRLCSVRFILVVLGLCLVLYIVRPPRLWHNSTLLASCPPCSCDCSRDSILSLPLDVINNSLEDCGKDDRDMNDEMKKDIISLLSGEINLHKNVTDDNLEHTNALIMSAKRASSHYQKETEKCNMGMEACEGAREMAEAALIQERKLSALWERRAIELGWKDK
ncbi:uncharacterized protein [Nicotiana sylvestris]|uniref:Uncharacterized protein LOC104227904 isoform X2 n=1 Tax=Nicotiana sylvestris TaxID=4096 RepID=A0A1U7WMR2_NICSY|nr:PREDICTED: uncharacterized protein LOC104227904 isoform X2 [Nicotiana sylvestris]